MWVLSIFTKVKVLFYQENYILLVLLPYLSLGLLSVEVADWTRVILEADQNVQAICMNQLLFLWPHFIMLSRNYTVNFGTLIAFDLFIDHNQTPHQKLVPVE